MHYKYTNGWWIDLTEARTRTHTSKHAKLTKDQGKYWHWIDMKLKSIHQMFVKSPVRLMSVSLAIFKEIWLLVSAISTLLHTASSDQGLSISLCISLRGLTLSQHSYLPKLWVWSLMDAETRWGASHEIDFEANSCRQLQRNSETLPPTLKNRGI